MLRAVSAIYIEGQSLVLVSSARRDVYKFFQNYFIQSIIGLTKSSLIILGVSYYKQTPNKSRIVIIAGSSSLAAAVHTSQTVLTTEGARGGAAGQGTPPADSPPAPPPPTAPPPPPPRRAWTVAAAALAVTASLGGVYFYRKLSDEKEPAHQKQHEERASDVGGEPPRPSSGAALPARVQYLLVGAGTASFAAMRAIRSARPDAQVLIVGEEPRLPYMRPPLSKELWRETDLARAPDLDALTFRQWNGRRRSVSYEPPVFYTPVEELAERGHGAAVARGWRVTRIDAAKHEAELSAPGLEPVVVQYDKCLVATGVRARRAAALRPAAAAGRALALRGLADAARLARELERPDVRRVLVLGGGFLASELSAALAERLRAEGREVLQVFREPAPMAAVLPPYLAAEAARRLREAGVELLPEAEVVESAVAEEGVRLRLASGARLDAQLVVECVGGEPDAELARRSGLETHPELGGLLVNAELQARADVFVAGDAACFYDVVLGRRRVEHHDHAVVSGRLAGANMAAASPADHKHYVHQSMFWSDLGPRLGYEAIGIIDSRLPTVGVFSEEAVTDAAAGAGTAGAGAAVQQAAGGDAASGQQVSAEPVERRYERGVVFYLRERRVVGVLLWNLFNRMHVARQVLAQGEFDDLFEVAKLFSLHEDE